MHDKGRENWRALHQKAAKLKRWLDRGCGCGCGCEEATRIITKRAEKLPPTATAFLGLREAETSIY